MPVRSLSSSVLKWPDAQATQLALRQWALEVGKSRQDVLQIGYFGSLARGDWGVGSDLDLVIVVEDSDRPFEQRSVEWDATKLPVPVDILVYTEREWKSLGKQRRFHQTLVREAMWVYLRER